jgi:hypothetical protein
MNAVCSQGPPKVINLNISPNNKRVEEAHRERVRERLVTVLNMQMPLVKDPRIRKSMPPAADLAKVLGKSLPCLLNVNFGREIFYSRGTFGRKAR